MDEGNVTNGTAEGGRSARWAKWLIPLAILVAIAVWVDVEEVAGALLTLPLADLAAALAIATFDRFLMAFKWRQLVLAGGAALRFPTALRIYYQASASGRVVPFPLGADILRAYLSSLVGVPHGIAVGSIAIERLMGLLGSVLMAVFGLAYLTSRLPPGVDQRLFYGLVGVGLVAVLVALVLVLLRRTHRLAGLAYEKIKGWRALPFRLERLAGKISRSLLQYRTQAPALAANAFLALVEQGVQFLKMGVLAYGLGIALPPALFVAIIALALFVRRIAGVIENWGLAEGSAALSLAILGIDAELAVALLVANFAVSTLAALPGAVLFYTAPVKDGGQ